MGVALVLLSAVAYGLITAFILTIINEIAILIHVGAVLEQPFIVKILTTLHLSVDSFSAACVWTVLLYVAFIVLFQLPPVQSLQLKFKNIYEPEGELGDFLYDCWDDVCERAGVNPDKVRNSVVFPQPDAPSKATKLPGAMARSIPFSTSLAP